MSGREIAAYGDFLRGLVNDPKGVSAPTPSSPALARAIAAEVDLSREGLVIELGPGTGVVTQALLQRGVPADRLVAIEQEPNFAQLMRKRFPSIKLYQHDAVNFEHCIKGGRDRIRLAAAELSSAQQALAVAACANLSGQRGQLHTIVV
jgi:phospholipid N-methyltransferase